ARDLGVLERIIGGSCRLKASVIERDEREAELRHVLNYGHTIGHALEASTGYARYAHGEAVALGIVAEARLARRLGIADEETTTRQERMLDTLGIPLPSPSRSWPISIARPGGRATRWRSAGMGSPATRTTRRPGSSWPRRSWPTASSPRPRSSSRRFSRRARKTCSAIAWRRRSS